MFQYSVIRPDHSCIMTLGFGRCNAGCQHSVGVNPGSLDHVIWPQLTLPPQCVACAGFFAFHLWLCVRYRLFRDTSRAIIKYTMLLLCYGE